MAGSWLAAPMVLAIALAQLSPPTGGLVAPPVVAPPPPITAPSSVPTSRGAGLVSGAPNAPQSVMIPGSPVPGTMFNNGNGTSTIMVPGAAPEVVPTPR